ncbi:MAG: EamA family transporter [Pseudohongiella sp.]|nr:EamA family transporter [Pseudohongiella sp.]
MSKFTLLLTHAFILAFMLASSHALMKWVSVQAHDNYLDLLLRQWPPILLSLFIYGIVFFYYILVLRSSPISTLYPIYTGLSVLFVLLVGTVLFKEAVSIWQIMGTALILSGIVLIGVNR